MSLEKARGDHDPADLGQSFLLIWMGSTLVNQVFSISVAERGKGLLECEA